MAWWNYGLAPRAQNRLCQKGSSAFIERLELRVLMAAHVPQNINLSQMFDNQSEGAIAIDPSNPNRIFAFSNIEFGDGLFTARSSDGGKNWSRKLIANDRDNLVPACCDPTASFDEFGNLFLGYVNSDTDAVQVIRSADGGKTFSRMATFAGDIDQPTVVAAEGSVWVAFNKGEHFFAAGAAVSGLGVVGAFAPLQKAPGPNGAHFRSGER